MTETDAEQHEPTTDAGPDLPVEPTPDPLPEPDPAPLPDAEPEPAPAPPAPGPDPRGEAKVALEAATQRVAEALDHLSVVAVRLEEPLPPLPPIPPVPDPDGKVGPWGRGPRSGLPWFHGCTAQSKGEVAAFEQATDCPVDIIQVFAPHQGFGRTRADIAGGPGSDVTKTWGLLEFTKGTAAAAKVWRDHLDKAAVLTIPWIPDELSNRKGANPGNLKKIAEGALDREMILLGRRMGYLDQTTGRTNRLVIEPYHEMCGGWYKHSIKGTLAGEPAWKLFPKVWERTVSQLMAGYRQQTGKDCPYLFWFRPSPQVVAPGIKAKHYLPSLELVHGVGLSIHDVSPYNVTPARPRAWWYDQPSGKPVLYEGLMSVAELAQASNRPLGFWEWGAHLNAPEELPTAGENYALFYKAVWDFFVEVRAILAGETFFNVSGTSPAHRPQHEANVVLRQAYGRTTPLRATAAALA